MKLIYLYDKGLHFGWKTGAFGYRAFCFGKWAVGRG
jgi:hypothetical protein